MRQEDYSKIKTFMLACMNDTVHDCLHVQRVLNYGLQIASTLPNACMDVVIAAALLHDIGRAAQRKDPSVCHGVVGSQKANAFLLENGWDPAFASHVSACILTHRHKKHLLPQSLEAKIIFDADKLDLIGNTGAARSILFGDQIGEPLYLVGADGLPTPGLPEEAPSLFREYNRKLKSLSDRLYTKKAKEIAAGQQREMNAYFENLMAEIHENYQNGLALLSEAVK